MNDTTGPTDRPTPTTGDTVVYGQYMGEFRDVAMTGPFRDGRAYTVLFRPDTKYLPLTIFADALELSGGPGGPQTYTVWSGGGQTRKIVGLFNAAEVVGIVRGVHQPAKTAT